VGVLIVTLRNMLFSCLEPGFETLRGFEFRRHLYIHEVRNNRRRRDCFLFAVRMVISFIMRFILSNEKGLST
jgi:hypothetical protein